MTFKEWEFTENNPYLPGSPERFTVDDGTGGGSSIPIATSDTVGGVMVGDGLAITDAGVLSASSDILFVHGEISVSDGNFTVTADKNYSDIKAAIDDDKFVIMVIPNNDGNSNMYFYMIDDTVNTSPVPSVINFVTRNISYNTNEITIFEIKVSVANNVSWIVDMKTCTVSATIS